MTVGGRFDRNMWHVLKGQVKFVVIYGMNKKKFNMLYHSRM